MALGKYSRVDGRKSSSGYCSTVTLVVFVALCLVGVWMMTSSSVPVQTVDMSSQDTKNEVRTQVSESNESNESNEQNESNENNEANTQNPSKSKQYEDNPGDLPDDATKGDANGTVAQEENNSSSQEKANVPEKTTENSTEGNQEEKPGKPSTEEENNNKDSSKVDKKNKEEKEDGEPKAEDKDSENRESKSKGEESNSEGQGDSKEGSGMGSNDANKKPDEDSGETKDGDKTESQIQERVEEKVKEKVEEMVKEKVEEEVEETLKEKVEPKQEQELDKSSGEKKEEGQIKDHNSNEVFPSGAELLNETATQNGAFSTQAAQSKNAKEVKSSEAKQESGYKWKLCNVTAGSDYIPCLDNLLAIKSLKTTKHYEHRERHCPEDPPTCLVPLPKGYQRSIEWPKSREKVLFLSS